ncbi:hypothetical protein [Carboxylicivirga linearis]|uniref:Uncharacterized protein n=1 Tax=Carboxylicivirga linearis TaxID=1628157 RepID=A0ABS5K053_9BACT|nr:hypothetical protein [Carboxylicivirga linearis]MBS2100518.1 hypothetical protein [Carboxylicivirga linearis]
MKQINQHIKKASVRFSRWIRKSWAVFNSLGREVSIGHLDVPVAGQALKKALRNSYVIQSEYSFDDLDAVDSDTVEENNLMWESLMLFLLPVLTLDLPSPSGNSSTYNVSENNWLTADYHLIKATSVLKWPEFVLPIIKQL